MKRLDISTFLVFDKRKNDWLTSNVIQRLESVGGDVKIIYQEPFGEYVTLNNEEFLVFNGVAVDDSKFRDQPEWVRKKLVDKGIIPSKFDGCVIFQGSIVRFSIVEDDDIKTSEGVVAMALNSDVVTQSKLTTTMLTFSFIVTDANKPIVLDKVVPGTIKVVGHMLSREHNIPDTPVFKFKGEQNRLSLN